MRADIELSSQEPIELGLPIRSPFDDDLIAWGPRLAEPSGLEFQEVQVAA